MKRCGLILATLSLLAAIGWLLHGTGLLAGSDAEPAPARASQLKNTDPLSTPAGWRYRQSQPHHWRYIMLKK
jgi:hypothetical protein